MRELAANGGANNIGQLLTAMMYQAPSGRDFGVSSRAFWKSVSRDDSTFDMIENNFGPR